MNKRDTRSEKVNGKPFAYVDDKKADHLGGDWSSPVEELVNVDVTDEE